MVVDLNTYRKTRKVALSIPFGERVATARKNQGVSQERFGEEIGYSQSIISRLETGALEWDPEVAASAAQALNKPSLLEFYCDECPVCKCHNRLRKNQPDKLA